ncbi:DUF805 domain-containing protein [Rhizobium sp. LjRoot254]|uniref:DUF805 domain-containing protein n=1 Tax=Rhizobium sp. LjRoot254 TaxID=3342297 RepID=UPI003ECC2C4B
MTLLIRAGDLLFNPSGILSRKGWWLGFGCIAVVIVALVYVSTTIALDVLSEVSARNIIAFYRFAGWMHFLLFLLLVYPFYVISIKRRRDRGSNGWDLQLCLLLNFATLASYAFGNQWVINVGGVGFIWTEHPKIASLIVPRPGVVLQYFSYLVTLATLVMYVQLGFFKGRENAGIGSASTIEPSVFSKAASWLWQLRYDRRAGMAVVVAAVLGLAIFLSTRQWSDEIAIGKPLPSKIEALMETTLSGHEASAGTLTVRLLATVRSKRGKQCRSFSVSGATPTVAVACQQKREWIATFAMASKNENERKEKLAAHFKAIGATIPFSEEGERLVFGL